MDWRPVSPRLVAERRLPVLVGAIIGAALIVTGVVATTATGEPVWPVAVAGGALVAASAVGWFFVVPRTVRAWRYAERAEDLLVSRGRLVRRLTVVPYGRMQVIEVSANPVSHRLGIATIALVTASASTDAKIPGLPVDVAHDLRDRLAAKGEAHTAGL